MEANPREYCLNDVLASKHYPQVLRVTRPYKVHDREYLKTGQYVTILDRRRVELLTGVDKEARSFKVRKDRSANVEVIEDDRIVYSLIEVAEVSNHITAIEIGKEIRIDKQTFMVGEKFTIEKIGKSFRGRLKNIALKREKDGKVYRLPLDIIGAFKLIAGKTKLPITKLLTLRALPLRAQFRNTPTSSNFPSGVATVRSSVICDIVYILTVQEETYTYEAFSLDAKVYVEKCNLSLPTPILKLIPNGMYVNSKEFVPPIKTIYKQRMAELDSKLIENIYAPGYYGSATYEKSLRIDKHLIVPVRSKTSLSLDESYTHAMRTLSDISSTSSTPDSELSGPPVLPRHSKKKHRQTMQFPAIQEFDWSQQQQRNRSVSQATGLNNHVRSATPPVLVSHLSSSSGGVIEFESESVTIEIPSSGVSSRSMSTDSMGNDSEIKHESQSIKVYCTPFSDTESLNGRERLVSRYYESPHGTTALRLSSRSSSITTEDSVDSGVVLTFGTPRGGPPSPMDENPYSLVYHRNNPNSNVRRITMPALTTPANQAQRPMYRPASMSPLTSQNSTTAEVRKVLVDTEIGNPDKNNNNNTIFVTNNNNNNDHETPTYYTHSYHSNAVQTDVTYKSLDNFDFRSHSVREEDAPRIPATHGGGDCMEERVNEIRGLSQEDTGLLLKCLNLTGYVPTFHKELINGNLLLELNENTLRRDLGMTQFDSRKLYKYVHGWRPIMSYADGSTVDSNPEYWSVSNVVEELQNIRLQVLANFCKENHVDGSLLIDIVRNNITGTLASEHNISLSGIELSRLHAFTLRKWRPDNSTTSTRNLSNTKQSRHSSYMTSQESINEKNRTKPPVWNLTRRNYGISLVN